MKYTIKKEHQSTRWYVKGQFHREDGPAIIYDSGAKSWWNYDKLHRIDGPAFECPHGNHLWYINGKKFSKEKFDLEVAKLTRTEPATVTN